jgi:hypothetical protein
MDKSLDNNTHNSQPPTKQGAGSGLGEKVACVRIDYFHQMMSSLCHLSYSGVANIIHGEFDPKLIQALLFNNLRRVWGDRSRTCARLD